MKPIKMLQGGLRLFGMTVGISLWMGLVATPSSATQVSGKQELGKEQTAKVLANYGKLPLHFEKNHGQVDSKVKYLSRGPGYTLFLTPDEAVLSLKPPKKSEEKPEATKIKDPGLLPDKDQSVNKESEEGVAVALKWLGAKPKSGLQGSALLPGHMNYFIGSDPAKWQTNIPTYSEVTLAGLYPGIDIRYYGSNEGRMEYDLIVAPKADPNQIQLGLNGADRVKLDKSGAVVVGVGELELQLAKPVIYQEGEKGREIVSGGYRLISNTKERAGKGTVIAFDLGVYDRKRPLIIDPVLAYSTYLGDNNYSGRSIAVDGSGAVYVTGDSSRASVTKLSADGSALLYSTYLGPFYSGYGIVVDGAGNAYVTGFTYASDFPTTVGAYDRTFDGYTDAVVVKLSPDGGTLLYSTYLGGGRSPGCSGGGEGGDWPQHCGGWVWRGLCYRRDLLSRLSHDRWSD